MQAVNSKQKFFTREEARRILRFSTSKLDSEMRAGRLKVHRFGRLVRIEAGDLDEYIRHGRDDAARELARDEGIFAEATGDRHDQ